MIENWVQNSVLKSSPTPGKIGHHMLEFQNKLNIQVGTRLAILGSDNRADPIRKELYDLAYPFQENILIDLGNLTTKSPDSIQEIFMELYAAQIIPVFIASDKDEFNIHFRSSLKEAITNAWAFVHPSLISDLNCKEEVLQAAEFGNASFKFIGHQIHLTPPDTIKNMDRLGMSSIRLGHVRQQIDAVEPWCRSLDHVMIDLSALRKTDFMAKKGNNPGGLFYEEACKICQFMGASAHLKSIGFYGYDAELDRDGLSAAVVAQLIWYTIEGYCNHREEKSIQKSKMTQYIVHNHQNGNDIHFWKNNSSGRWWLEIPGHADHWISCTYEDYHAASIGSYSSRIVSVLNLE